MLSKPKSTYISRQIVEGAGRDVFVIMGNEAKCIHLEGPSYEIFLLILSSPSFVVLG